MPSILVSCRLTCEQEDTHEAEQQTSSEARAFFGGGLKDASVTNADVNVEADTPTEKL